MCHLQVFTIKLRIMLLIFTKIKSVLIVTVIIREDDRSGKDAKVNYGLWRQGTQTTQEQ